MKTTWLPFGAWTSAPPWLADRQAPTDVLLTTTWLRLSSRLLLHPAAPSSLPWACSVRCTQARFRRPGPCPRCKVAPLQPDKTSLPAWSPWLFQAPRRRRPAEVSALVLDYDGGASLAQIRDTWAPWAHAAHTSWSHATDSPRARVVLPLAAPVDVQTWPRVWAWATARDPRMDVSVGDAGRLYFLPFARPDRPHAAWDHRGPVLDISRLQLPEIEQAAPRERPPSPRADRARADELRRSPDARRELAVKLGARLTGEGENERARRCPSCPQCGENSVWWWMRPRSWEGCGCDHDSCGWTGWLDQLEGAT